MTCSFLQPKQGNAPIKTPVPMDDCKGVREFWEKHGATAFPDGIPSVSEVIRQASRIMMIKKDGKIVATALIHKCSSLRRKVKVLDVDNIISTLPDGKNSKGFIKLFKLFLETFQQKGGETRRAIVLDSTNTHDTLRSESMYDDYGFEPLGTCYIREV